MDVNKH